MKILLPVILAMFMLSPASLAMAGQRYAELINDFYNRQPSLCLGESLWPIPVRAAAAPWESGRLAALTDAGLAMVRDGKFILTPAGYRNWKSYGDLCYGRMAVSHIIRVEQRSATTTAVWFTYYLSRREKWATTPSLRHAFSELDNLLSGEKHSLWIATLTATAGQLRLQDYPLPDQLEY